MPAKKTPSDALIAEIMKKSGTKTLDPRFVSLLMSSLLELSTGYHSALYKAGAVVGEKFSSYINVRELRRAEEESSHFFSLLGFGTVRFEEQGRADLFVSVENCAFCASAKSNTFHCPFIAGFLSALFYSVMGERYTCVEKECRSLGNDRCTFIAKSLSEEFLESF